MLIGAGMACQLTSPQPASWAGTPTAEAWSTSIAQTQVARQGAGAYVFTPTAPNPTPEPSPTPTLTPTPGALVHGPWLLFPAPEGQGLGVYDLGAQDILTIDLPWPIITADLTRGRSPDGSQLVLRAGSPYNTDELALYRIDLTSFEVNQVTPLLPIALQRKIVNEEDARALTALETVTRPDGLAWSPDGRFLAFNAALHNETSDLYVLDTLNNRVDRLNGLSTQSASSLWSPGGDWLISQELEYLPQDGVWRSGMVSGQRVLSFDSQFTVYLPQENSTQEVFVGWLNPATFISYSDTASGARLIRQVNVEDLDERLIFEDAFHQLAFDPGSGTLAFILNFDNAPPQNLAGGIYRLQPESPIPSLQAAGNWEYLTWDPGGEFVASGAQGSLLFTPQGESLLLPGEGLARLSPNGNWMIAWGDGENTTAGARLYQSENNRPLQTLIDQPVEALIWQPDSKGFFILSTGTLYHFAFPGLKPTGVIREMPQDIALDWIWVE